MKEKIIPDIQEGTEIQGTEAQGKEVINLTGNTSNAVKGTVETLKNYDGEVKVITPQGNRVIGFIKILGMKDVFFYIGNIKNEDELEEIMEKYKKGSKVKFNLEQSPKGPMAINLSEVE